MEEDCELQASVVGLPSCSHETRASRDLKKPLRPQKTHVKRWGEVLAVTKSPEPAVEVIAEALPLSRYSLRMTPETGFQGRPQVAAKSSSNWSIPSNGSGVPSETANGETTDEVRVDAKVRFKKSTSC